MKKTIAPVLALGFAGAALATTATAPAQAAGFRSCAAVRAAGIPTPIPFGAPHYQANLDGDDDGWACEPRGVTLPDPRKKVNSAPVRTATQAPAPTKPAPAAQTPAHATHPTKPAPVVQPPADATHPAQPAPATSAGNGVGPKINTDRVSTDDASATTLAAFGLLAGAAGAGAWRIRSAGKH